MSTYYTLSINHKVEITMKVPTPSEIEQRCALETHFSLLYELMVDCKYIPNAICETVNGVKRCLSGSPDPFDNAILTCSQSEITWDKHIVEQIDYFKGAGVPFAWHVDNESHQDLENALVRHGFEKHDSIYGFAGNIDKPIDLITFPIGYTIERVSSDETYRALTKLVCATFEYAKELEENYYQLFKMKSEGDQPVWSHWVAKKDDIVVSAISTMIKDNVVSFWNGATLPEHRNRGLSKALTHTALRNAAERGCLIGITYLSAEQQALGIVKGLGGRHIYSFNTYYASRG